MSEHEPKSVEEIADKIRNAVDEYENQRQVCLSFRKHFSQLKDTKAWSEPVMRLPNKAYKTPDLLLAQQDWLALDYKQITSRSKTTLNTHITDVNEYRQTFTFRGTSFEPDVAIICPMNVASAFRDLVNTVPILSCKLGKNIKLKRVAGQFKSPELSKLFSEEVAFPLATELTMQKFLRHDPKAIAYTAEIVRTVLWQLNATLGSDDVQATRQQLVDIMSTLYPPYLRSHKSEEFEVQQVTSGRVNQALEFLEKIDFISIKKAERGKENEDVISTSKRKGLQVTNFRDFFIQKQAELEYDTQLKAQRKEERATQRRLAREQRQRERDAMRSMGQRRLEEFYM